MLSVVMLSVVMLSVVMLSVVMLSVVMRSVVMLNVMAPFAKANFVYRWITDFITAKLYFISNYYLGTSGTFFLVSITKNFIFFGPGK